MDRPTGAYPPVIVVVGPTGVGKTSTAIQIAIEVQGEVVSTDSRQVYRFMDIGTAKPNPEEQREIPHHLIDFLDPDETLTLAQFQRLAFDALDKIHSQNRVPLLVGGTGQYVRAVVEGWGIPEVPPHPELRMELQARADEHGPEILHQQLQSVDQEAAEKIDYRNVRRVIRALEVYEVTGKPISELQKRTPPPYNFLMIGLTRPRELLYERIDERIDAMIDQGLRQEVRTLLARGYSWDLPSMSGLGYAQFEPYFSGDATIEEVIAEIKRDTRRFIRHQYNWFKLNDDEISWVDLEVQDSQSAVSLVKEWLLTVESFRS